MSCYPHTRLFQTQKHAIAITGPHSTVLNAVTGSTLHSTASADHPEREGAEKSGPVRCAALDTSGAHLVTACDDKKLKVWAVDGLRLLSSRELPKKATDLAFVQNGDILVADKFGDVFRYPLQHTPPPPPLPGNPEPKQEEEGHAKDVLASHENPSGGELVLGHASVLTRVLLAPHGDYVLTADRDEHIRVSWYPEGYTIESYCLGHTKYVSAIHIPSFAPSLLLSGGGDPMLKVWDWLSGAHVRDIPILDAVLPFIVVRPPPRVRGGDGEAKQGKRGKQRNRKGKQKAGEQEHASETATPEPAQSVGAQEKEDEPVLVVRNISSFESEGGRFVVFNVVGATALFVLPWTEGDAARSIAYFDFKKPVIDFSVSHDQKLWVLLDVNWTPKDSTEALNTDTRFVRVLSLSKGTLVEDSSTPLLEALNTQVTVPATPDALKALDLYSDLASLPKNVSGEDNEGDAPTKRELGRQKHKDALAKKLTGGHGQEEEEEEGGEDGSEAGDGEGKRKIEGAASGREAKKAKVVEGEDVDMAEDS
ncbi:WD40 repeat-like protein [Coniophora puteana RWD-64-598 SS2]|uniref:WD40 repeat-like protein n=1 Tax=Coniophora puteana (strain RWD-64-598) TaxID=741705 RepID=A0A5M3MKA0_CONPW|nr:WD40 repeat-like protein [Coniophora puteana RWD-64-598 SS2]EIW79075.1 WD40 repeat-like protein [Coniophora puteana RWD-64-598 SS2]